MSPFFMVKGVVNNKLKYGDLYKLEVTRCQLFSEVIISCPFLARDYFRMF